MLNCHPSFEYAQTWIAGLKFNQRLIRMRTMIFEGRFICLCCAKILEDIDQSAVVQGHRPLVICKCTKTHLALRENWGLITKSY